MTELLQRLNMQIKNSDSTEFEKIRKISHGNEIAFEELFFEYYYPLCRFAVKITRCSELARDAVQEVFVKLWKTRGNREIVHSVKAYLYQSVRNQALNLVEQQSSRLAMRERFKKEQVADLQNDDHLNGLSSHYMASHSNRLSDFVNQIWLLVDQMPDQRKLVFLLHRKHGLSYLEISGVMGITRKTVENHMGKALQDLRDNLNSTHLV